MIKTGITTELDFRKALGSRGVALSNNATAEGLLRGLKTMKDTITFESDNDDVIRAINVDPNTFNPTFIMRTDNNHGPLNNLMLLGAKSEGFFSEEFWTKNSEGSYTLKSGIDIYLGEAKLEEVGYSFDNGFNFSLTDDLANVVDQYPDMLTGCPVHIKAVEGIFTFNGKKSAATELHELYNIEHKPYWLLKSDAEYNELDNKYTK